MIKTLTSPRFIFIATLILMAALSRLLPHPPNFTPVAAIALLGGAYLSKRLAFLLPLAAMFISDLIIGFHSTMWAVYLSMAIISFIGIGLAKGLNVQKIIGGALTGSLIFFVVTNFAVWMGSAYYTQDVAGLIHCYTLAIPFFSNTVMGDLFYSGILFGSYYLARQRFPQLA
jgi:hypothetical protein